MPGELAGGLQAIQFAATIEQPNGMILIQGLLDDVLVLFFFQRTSGISKAPAGDDLIQRGAKDGRLTFV